MRWEDCLRENKVEKRKIDKELAKSQVKIAKERFEFFKSIKLGESTTRFVLEGYYEAILELIHALLSLHGLKTLSHECAIEFLREKYLDNSEVEFLQNVRKLRHAVKYYGKLVKYQNALIIVQKEMKIFEKLSHLLENKIKLVK